MQTPKPDSHYSRFVRSGLYTVGRLLRAHRADLAEPIKQATMTVLDEGRRLEDAGFASMDFYAGRDAIDDSIDIQTQLGRQELANRGLGAEKKTPYTSVFPDGIKWYIEANLDQQVGRFETFINR